MKPRIQSQGFVLLECMLAVAIFALGIIALGRCVENCLKAERFRREEGLAQRALANYWIQMEEGAFPDKDEFTENMKGAWDGMTMKVSRKPFELKNEKDQDVAGIYQVKLLLTWPSGSETETREMEFLMFPQQR